jgi:hypothetical protein
VGQTITAASGTTLALGMVATLASVVYAAFRAGSNTHLFTLEGSLDGGDDAPERESLLESGAGGPDAPPSEANAAMTRGHAATNGPSAMDEFTPVSYNYAFFHMIFALASMYIAMLMTGWGQVEQDKERIDVGWVSVWVKISAQWLTGLLYVWTLMAPALFPDREFA